MANKFLDGLKNVVGAVAPMLGSAFGGPLGAQAGMMLKRKLLGKEDATDEELAAVVATDSPEVRQKIREVEIEYQKFLEESYTKRLEMDIVDRANARAREITLKDWTPTGLAWTYTIGFFGTIAFLLKWGLPPAGDTVMSLLIGALTVGEGTILSYYFGSSSGSKSKSDTIEVLAAKKA